LYFASEIKSILATGAISREIDFEALDHYISFFIPLVTRRSSPGFASCRPDTSCAGTPGGGSRYWNCPHRRSGLRRRRSRTCARCCATPCVPI
jgi:hypothetical protein